MKSRRERTRLCTLAALASVVVVAMSVVTACSGTTASDEDIQAAVASLPEYYPGEYQEIIRASTQEDGVDVYGITPVPAWTPLISAFNERYPWIDVRPLDLGAAEVFERHIGESSGGQAAADLLQSVASAGWWDFVTHDDGVDTYASPERDHLPEIAEPLGGVYTQTTDPLVIVYNKKTIPEEDWPTSVADLEALAARDPERYKGKLTTYSLSETYPMMKVLYDSDPAGFERRFAALGSMTQLESSSGPMLEKIAAGEYIAAYYVSSAALALPIFTGAGSDLLGWTLPKDGTPLIARNIGIPKGANAPNSARLLLDFLLSDEGQTLLPDADLTPVADVSVPENWFSYKTLTDSLDGRVPVAQPSEALASGKAYEELNTLWQGLFQK